jgi:hypothetical protein
MARKAIDKLLDWICARIGLRLCFDGNLMDAEDC